MLEVRDLRIRYGPVVAVDGLSVTVTEREIVLMVGANGAGKTSTMMAISGVVRPASGTITFMGERIDGLAPRKIVSRGIVQVPEGRLIFNDMSVEENLLIGAYGRPLAEVRATLGEVWETFPLLRDRRRDRAATLSGGQLQLLAIARGLMARPKLLLLDEPSLGLAPLATKELFALIGRLKQRGLTILLVDQNARQALKVADRAYVLETGRAVRCRPARLLLREEDLTESLMSGSAGRRGPEAERREAPTEAEPANPERLPRHP